MRKAAGIILKWGLVLGCMVYVFWDIEWGEFWESFKTIGVWPILGALAYSLVQYIPVAFRLNFLTRFRAGFLTSLKASVFCLGINNILPAKLGEVAKAFYLRKKSNIQLGEGLGLIFWERLFDLNMLLVLGVLAALMLGQAKVVLPLALVVGALWGFVIVLRMAPKTKDLILKILPGEKVKLLARDAMAQVLEQGKPRFFGVLGLYSLVAWIGFYSMYYVVLQLVGGLDLTPAQVLAVFVGATFGMAMPSTPSAVGPFEAAFVFALGLFDVAKGPALALAITMRICIFVPPVLAALYVMAQSGMSLKGIRQHGEETL